MNKGGFTYILSNKSKTLYTGVTSDLIKRIYQHKNKLVQGFTAKYNIQKLVDYESFGTIKEAIIREKQIKDMNRVDKLNMIKEVNPSFEDFYLKIK